MYLHMAKQDSKTNVERMPPQNLEAEQSLLSCLLIDKDAITRVVDTLFKEDFYKDSHGTIYETMRELYGKGEPIDILTLSNRLKEKKELENIGGKSYLAQLSAYVATASNVKHYAKIIQNKATLRKLQQAAREISELSYQEDEDVDNILDKTEGKILSISQKYTQNIFLPIDDLLSEAFTRIDELHKQSGKLRGLPTGFSDLDGLLGGFQKSDLVILAARLTDERIVSTNPISFSSFWYSSRMKNRSLIKPPFSLIMARGLLISWATPAAMRPMDAILFSYSILCSAATRFSSAERSWLTI